MAFASAAQQPAIFLADPTIFADNGKYYLYGTSSSEVSCSMSLPI